MKKCPTCQKTYEDNLRFCQTDGTPLVDDAPPPDPYATMVASKDDIMSAMPPKKEEPRETPPAAPEEDDLLDIPDEGDNMKTAFVSESERREMFDEPSSKPIPPPISRQDELQKEESKGSEGDTLLAQPEPPKFNEPNLNPPNFGDLPPQSESPAPPASPFGKEPPSFDKQPLPSDFETPRRADESSSNPPIPSPFGEKMPPQREAPSSPPFAPPEFAAEEVKAEQLNTPFAEEVSQGNQQMAEKGSWTPPAAPSGPSGTSVGQKPPAAGGENKTLAIVSLALGILSIPCCGFVIFGLAAVVTGFMARGKATNNPKEYGGAGLAMAGIIIGALTTLLGIIGNILALLGMIPIPNM